MKTTARQRVCILGSTGSIGTNTLDVISRHPGRFEVFALTGASRVDELLAQCLRFAPRYAAMPDAACARRLREGLAAAGSRVEVLDTPAALSELAAHPEVDSVMAAIVGAAGLAPCLAAARAGKRLMLANKEALVVGGELFMRAVHEGGARLLPIDSEHSAIFQCLPEDAATWPARIDHIVLTASGGPFRTRDPATLRDVTPDMACAHPNFVMGRKISVQLAEHVDRPRGLGHEQHGPDEVVEDDELALPGHRGEVLRDDVADDLVEGAVVDRHPRAALLEEAALELLGPGGLRQGDDAAARHHHVARGEVAEGEGPRGDLRRRRVEGAGLPRLVHELLELLHREAGLGEGGPVAEGAQHRVGRRREEPHHRPGQHLALGAAGGARGGADRVAGLLRQQRFVAPHRVDRLQPLGEVLGELLGADLHRGSSDRRHRGQAAHHLRDDVALHRAEQEGLFLLLRERDGLAVAHVAAEQDLRGGDQLATARRADAEVQPRPQLQLAHLSGRGRRDDAALARIGDRLEHDLRLRDGVDHERGAAGVDVAAQFLGQRGARREAGRRARGGPAVGVSMPPARRGLRRARPRGGRPAPRWPAGAPGP